MAHDGATTAFPPDSLAAQMQSMGRRARAASKAVSGVDAGRRTQALQAMAKAVRANTKEVLAGNVRDMRAARDNDLAAPLLDRLELTAARLGAVASGLEAVAALPDPVGAVIDTRVRPNGLKISRVRGPIGVIAVIYESRPNVTADAGALCIRAGNAAILRGGSESRHSSAALANALRTGLAEAGLPEDAVQAVPTTDRGAVGHLLRGLDGTVDLLIPRGGKGLVKRVRDEARIPVLGHLEGICHTYVHAAANAPGATAIVRNAKLRRPGICGATETLLIDAAIATAILPDMVAAMPECEWRGCARTRAIQPMAEASEKDWRTEYLAPILSVRVVDGLEDALAHIETYGSGHTEAILTEDDGVGAEFLRRVDAAIVMRNASTQFADGGEFGIGAEIGIATGRLHARGPVGAEELTVARFLVEGDGQIRP